MFLSCKKQNKGFTLIEIIVVIIIVGTLAAIALPRFTGMFERTRVSEGIQFLTVLLGAQKAYEVENGAYATVAGDLDIEITRSANFVLPPTVANPGNPVTNPIATILRTGAYTLCINEEGTISCKNGGGGFTCAQAGITNVCP